MTERNMIIIRQKEFTGREKVPKETLEKAKESGVIQRKPGGAWGIISLRDGEFWVQDYSSKERAQAALRGYQANKHGG